MEAYISKASTHAQRSWRAVGEQLESSWRAVGEHRDPTERETGLKLQKKTGTLPTGAQHIFNIFTL